MTATAAPMKAVSASFENTARLLRRSEPMRLMKTTVHTRNTTYKSGNERCLNSVKSPHGVDGVIRIIPINDTIKKTGKVPKQSRRERVLDKHDIAG